MPKFSAVSHDRLNTCDPRLRQLFERVVEQYDCSILVGFRGREEQNIAYNDGRSDKPWPLSKHNSEPSLALDAAPYPIRWKDTKRFYHFAGYVKAIAEELGIKIRWGGDWDGDLDFSDQDLYDLVHFEIKE